MSQEGGNVAVSADQVRNAISNLMDREKSMLTNLEAISGSIMTAADYLSILKDSSQVGTYKELMLELGKLSHEVKIHQGVLQNVGQTYKPSLEETDFKALLEQGLRNRLQQQPYKPQNDSRLKEFLEVVGEAGAGGGGGGEDLEDDDEVWEAGTGHSWVNDKCPLSMKPVLDLERPVKDPLGYVYEHASITEYLRGRPDGPDGHRHPVAGVTLKLKASDLKPAEDVQRAKRRRRLLEAMGGGAGGSNLPENEEDIIDV